MYCHECGLYNNAREVTECTVCGASVVDKTQAPMTPVNMDLTRLPFSQASRPLFEGNALAGLVLLPFFLARYHLARALSGELMAPLYRSKAPRGKTLDLSTYPRLDRDAFSDVHGYLHRGGFKPVIDFEDTSLVKPEVKRILVNAEQRMYAVLVIDAATGHVACVQFFIITPKGGFVSVDNVAGLPVRYPAGLAVLHRPGSSVGELHEWFLAHVKRTGEQGMVISAPLLMPYLNKVRTATISAGIKDKVLVEPAPDDDLPAAVDQTRCANHADTPAVRACSQCAAPLCEECVQRVQGAVWCEACAVRSGQQVDGAAGLELPPGMGYAGFAVRVASVVFDALMIGAVGVAGYYAAYGIGLAVSPEDATTLGLLTGPPAAALFAAYSLLVRVILNGRSLGQWVWRLYVTDEHGRKPDAISAIVRLGSGLVSVLLVVPAVVSAASVLKGASRALQDTLAATFVVTREPQDKEKLAWPVAVLGLLAVAAAPLAVVWMVTSPMRAGVSVNPALELRWARDTHGSVVMRDGLVMEIVDTLLVAWSPVNGETQWQTAVAPGARIDSLSTDSTQPLFIREAYGDEDSLVRVHPRSGNRLWQFACGTELRRTASDGKLTVVYGHHLLQVIGRGGKPGWQYAFDDNMSRMDIWINGGVLAARYPSGGNDTCQLSFIDADKGTVTWTAEPNAFMPIRPLVGGYHLCRKQSGELVLLGLSDQRTWWQVPADMGSDKSFEYDGGRWRHGPPPGMLYCERGVLDTRTGKALCAYPEGTVYGNRTIEFVAALGGDEIGPNGLPPLYRTLQTVYVEKCRAGQPLEVPGAGRIVLAEQGADHVFVGVSYTEGRMVKASKTSLYTLPKKGEGGSVVALGTGAGLATTRMLPLHGIVVVPSQTGLAGYALP